MVAVGGIVIFVTAGTSTPLVVAGVAFVILGVGDEIASATALHNLNDTKATILIRDSSLKEEVNLASGIGTGYNGLKNQLKFCTRQPNAICTQLCFGILLCSLISFQTLHLKCILASNARKTLKIPSLIAIISSYPPK